MYNIKYTWFYSTFLQPRISTGSAIFQCFHLFSPFLYSAPWRDGGFGLIYFIQTSNLMPMFSSSVSLYRARQNPFISGVYQSYIYFRRHITLNYFSKKQFLSFAFAFSGTILFVVLLLVPPSSGWLMRESGCDTEALLRRPSSPARNRESFNVSAGSWRDGGFRLLFIRRQTWRQFHLVLPQYNGSGRTLLDLAKTRPTYISADILHWIIFQKSSFYHLHLHFPLQYYL